jgi:hypothetical protein
MGTEMKRRITERIENGFYNDVDYFGDIYQIAEDILGDETIIYHCLPTELKSKPKPVKVEGKCCERCVHRYGDKMDYCVRHNYDDNCYRFKLEK